VASLTPRESEVLALIGRGMRCTEIATVLGVAVFTVRKHRSNLLGKLGLHSSAKLRAYATRASQSSLATIGLGEVHALSRREREVVALVGEGLTSKEIARRLGISPTTVSKHRQNVMRRNAGRHLPMIALCTSSSRNTQSELFPEQIFSALNHAAPFVAPAESFSHADRVAGVADSCGAESHPDAAPQRPILSDEENDHG
jgi:DNA-binding CsgD family transcriptional regulator